jgi:Leucine-rich repeat (LRR) protein
LSIVAICVAISSFFVRADEISCKVEVIESIEGDNKFYCTFGEDAGIANQNPKLTNERNDEVSVLLANGANGIKYLPIDIVDVFPNLRNISMHQTSIETLSKRNFHGLSNLFFLEVSYNEVTEVNEGTFDDCVELRSLVLERNRLPMLPAKLLWKLAKLDKVDLYANEITSLDLDTFKNNKQLTSIDLSYNRLTTLPPGIFDSLPLLKNLRLNVNKLSTIHSEWFRNCPELSRLLFAKNKISEIPVDVFDNSPNLTYIEFSNNPITTIDLKTFKNNKLRVEIRFDEIKVKRVLNIDMLPESFKITFYLGERSSCVHHDYTENDIDKLKQVVQQNCRN